MTTTVTLSESRQNKNGVIYGYWQANWWSDGKHTSTTVGRSNGHKRISRADAKRKCRELEADLNNKDAAPKASPTIEEYEDTYFRLRPKMNPATRVIYEQTFAALADHFGGDCCLHEVKPIEAEAWVVELAETYSDATVNKFVRHAKAIFGDGRFGAMGRELILSNPFRKLDGSSVAGEIVYVPEPVCRAVIDELPDVHWKCLFALARFCGLRTPSEPLLLTWDRVLFDKNRLNVIDKKRSRVEAKQKDRQVRERIVLLDERALPFLLAAREACPPRTSAVLPFTATPWEVHRMVDAAITRAGVARWPNLMKSLRQSAENDWAQLGYPQHVVSSWVGHSMQVSEKHYLTVDDRYYAKPDSVETALKPLPQPGGETAPVAAAVAVRRLLIEVPQTVRA